MIQKSNITLWKSASFQRLPPKLSHRENGMRRRRAKGICNFIRARETNQLSSWVPQRVHVADKKDTPIGILQPSDVTTTCNFAQGPCIVCIFLSGPLCFDIFFTIQPSVFRVLILRVAQVVKTLIFNSRGHHFEFFIATGDLSNR